MLYKDTSYKNRGTTNQIKYIQVNIYSQHDGRVYISISVGKKWENGGWLY